MTDLESKQIDAVVSKVVEVIGTVDPMFIPEILKRIARTMIMRMGRSEKVQLAIDLMSALRK